MMVIVVMDNTLVLTRIILFVVLFASSSNAFQSSQYVHTPRKLPSIAENIPKQTFLSFQLSNNDNGGKDVGFIIDNEDASSKKNYNVAKMQEKSIEEVIGYGKAFPNFDDDSMLDLLAITLIVGIVGFAVYALVDLSSQSSEIVGNDIEKMLDWKDLFAFTVGETVSSLFLQGVLFLGEVSIFRSIFSTSYKDTVIEENDDIVSRITTIDKDNDNEQVHWDAISVDIGSWIIYAFLKDDLLGGKMGISNSAFESAVFGLFASLIMRLIVDFIIAKLDIFPNSDELRQEMRHRDFPKWLEIYAKSAVSVALLFSVYEFILHLL